MWNAIHCIYVSACILGSGGGVYNNVFTIHDQKSMNFLLDQYPLFTRDSKHKHMGSLKWFLNMSNGNMRTNNILPASFCQGKKGSQTCTVPIYGWDIDTRPQLLLTNMFPHYEVTVDIAIWPICSLTTRLLLI